SNWVGRDTAWIDRLTIPVLAGDRILVCSDGLTNMVLDADIAAVLAAESDDATCVQTLIDAANAAGGIDNITVAVASLLP
ncbi:MAG: serine/threonine protein phosphatase, partial [Acidimicrobiia bacterium]